MIKSELSRFLKTKVLLSENNKDLLNHINQIQDMLESNKDLRLERSELDKLQTKIQEVWETIRGCVLTMESKII